MSRKRARKKGGGGLPIVGQGALRPAAPAPAIKASPMGRRRVWVFTFVHLLIAAHIAYWWQTGRAISPLEPSEAMELSKHGMVNAGAVFFAVTILATLVFGRFFCGWGCHILALQDLAAAALKRVGIRPRPFQSRILLWVPALAFLYMFVWPLAYRLWIHDSLAVRGFELTTTDFWATFPGWPVALATFFVCGFAIVYFLGQKGFCTYACPYGAAFSWADRFSPLRIRVNDACAGCGHCTAVCTSNVRVHEEVRDYGAVMDAGCMKCLDCVAVCPNDALSVSWGKPAAWMGPRVENPAIAKPPLSRTEEVLLAAVFVASLSVFRGLYGWFPFLFSLGLAAILAYLAWLCRRLIQRPNVRLRRAQLKRAGRLTKSGGVFIVLMGAVFVFWGHSAWIQYHGWAGSRAFESSSQRVLEVSAESSLVPLAQDERLSLARAIRHWSKVADYGLANPWSLELRLARIHLLMDQPSAMENRLRRAAEAGAPAERIHSVRGDGHMAARRWRPAVEEYRRAVEANASRPAYHLRLGTLLAGLGDVQGALSAFERGLAEVPDSADLNYNAGLALALAGAAEEAVGRFEAALRLDPDHLAARENLAGVLAAMGRLDESLESYERALALNPDDAETRVLKARVLLALGRTSDAAAQAREALRLDPGSSEARGLLDEIAAAN